MMEFLRTGGPIMYPLVLCSLLALAVVIEKLINLRRSVIFRPSVMETLDNLIAEGMIDRAVQYSRRNPGVLSDIVLAALEALPLGRDEVKEAVESAGRHAVPRLERYLGLLGVVAGVSPLLGLFGTVLGMIKVFRAISVGGLGQAERLAGGISEALITTAVGLGIAIPAYVLYNLLRARVTTLTLDMERFALDLIARLFQAQGPPAEARPAPAADPETKRSRPPAGRTKGGTR